MACVLDATGDATFVRHALELSSDVALAALEPLGLLHDEPRQAGDLRRCEWGDQLVAAGIVSVLALPLPWSDGHLLVFDGEARSWSEEEIELLRDLLVTQAPSQHAVAQRLINAIGAIFWECDARTWEFTYVSPQAERILGYPLERWFGDASFWPAIIHPDDREQAIQCCLRSSGAEDEFEFEYRAVAEDGRVLWLRDMVNVKRDQNGPISLSGIMFDITAQKEVEHELRLRTSLLECENDAAIDGILVVSPDNRVLSHNKRFVQLWDISEEALRTGLDRALIDAVLEKLIDPNTFRARSAHLHEHPYEHSHDELELKDGRIFHRYSSPVRSPAGELFGRAWFFRDVTEVRAAERRKDEFLALLGHELRNPLSPILTSLYLLESRRADPAVAERAHGIIARQVRQMVRLVDDLLDVGRITRGAIELRRDVVALGLILATAIETTRALFEASSHRLSVSQPSREVYLDADPGRLEQVFTNLLSNAARYTQSNGQVWIDLTLEDGHAIVRIKDSGIGIDPKLLPRIFEPFVRGATALERAHGGLGVGLALVRQLVRLHGGEVEARSDGPGLGSEFTVRFPMAADPALERAPVSLDDTALPALDVLIVDDNVDAADSLADYLRNAGSTVRVAYTGASAIEMALAAPPELLLLDIGLPDIDGIKVAGRLREVPSLAQTVLVAITGYGQPDDRRRSEEAGFARHFNKPLDLDAFREMLVGFAALKETPPDGARGRRRRALRKPASTP